MGTILNTIYTLLKLKIRLIKSLYRIPTNTLCPGIAPMAEIKSQYSFGKSKQYISIVVWKFKSVPQLL